MYVRVCLHVCVCPHVALKWMPCHSIEKNLSLETRPSGFFSVSRWYLSLFQTANSINEKLNKQGERTSYVPEKLWQNMTQASFEIFQRTLFTVLVPLVPSNRSGLEGALFQLPPANPSRRGTSKGPSGAAHPERYIGQGDRPVRFASDRSVRSDALC